MGRQLKLDYWAGKHGGPRKGAGRKPKGRRPGVRHRVRPDVALDEPRHVTLRVRRDVRKLRQFKVWRELRRVFFLACEKGNFRICQFSVQGNHIHMICEAESRQALSRGVQGFSIRAARAINRAHRRKGSVFSDRYHAVAIKNATQVRNTLRYVLQNARRHGEAPPRKPTWVDPFSSAYYFDGFCHRVGRPPPSDPGPLVAEPRSHLLARAWRRLGLLDPGAHPASSPFA